ncbi:MAG: NADH-quinone oxidoreductase subunit M [Proteobacteria bacterium]|nr:NADH-quinone oxidoreductase subunit M [Pseudomonadota bacterium]
MGLISLLIFLPLAGAVLIALGPREKPGLLRGIALTTSVATFLLSLGLFTRFVAGEGGFQLVEMRPWVPGLGITYRVGIDGISLFLVLLSTLLSVVAMAASWSDIKVRVKEFMICLLFLETGMIGVFVALDLFLFYVFWEVMLIPMYLLIGIWGNPGRRIYAAVKFFLFTMFGSLLMLVAILVMYFYHGKTTGIYTFDLMSWYNLKLPLSMQVWLFLAFGLAFAIKVPMFPFHTWLPDAHTEAPTVGSVLLAAVLLKMGTYGFLRFNLPLFPEATVMFVPLLAGLSLVGIIYGALVAMVQVDVKRLVAFSSVSHMGFVVLGIFALNVEGMTGAMLQMLNHGFSTGALFLIVGMIYERRHTRMIADFGGLSTVMPVFATFFLIVALSSIGLPGLNGFVGEFLVLLGAFQAEPLWAVVAGLGLILAAVYMLWMFQRVMFGEVDKEENRGLKDLNLREAALLLVMVFFIIQFGVYPKPYIDRIEPSLKLVLKRVEERGAPLRPAAATAAEKPAAATAPQHFTTQHHN